MTGSGRGSLRMQTAVDRLRWGFGDLKRILMQRGMWPALSVSLRDATGGSWALLGSLLRQTTSVRRAPEGLLIPEEQCLWGQLELPDVPCKALGDAVSESMWRVSPIPPGQIMVAWRAQPAVGHGWTITWGLCKQSFVLDLLDRQGLSSDTPVYLEYQGSALPVNGRGRQSLQKRQRWMDVLGWGLVTLLAGAILLPVIMPLALQRQAVVRAVVHVGGLEPKAAPLRGQLDELRSKAALVQELKQGVAGNVPFASVLEVLSEALPDDTWLDRIEINGKEIRVMGLTGNAADLLTRLGRQPLLADVRATSANVRDGSLGKERFTFEMRWREAEGARP